MQQLNIKLNQTTPVNCRCGNGTFTDGVLLRKASKFLTGTDKDSLVPIGVMVCLKCNEPLEETLPIELKELNENPEPPKDSPSKLSIVRN